ncbi:hypothetical protein RRSWK_05462 [Rhodopirellula sp. SWK7]|nr:hypothetical protein RRSWK_05462 [Rhodopirellula sp. SWK7]
MKRDKPKANEQYGSLNGWTICHDALSQKKSLWPNKMMCPLSGCGTSLRELLITFRRDQ